MLVEHDGEKPQLYFYCILYCIVVHLYVYSNLQHNTKNTDQEFTIELVRLLGVGQVGFGISWRCESVRVRAGAVHELRGTVRLLRLGSGVVAACDRGGAEHMLLERRETRAQLVLHRRLLVQLRQQEARLARRCRQTWVQAHSHPIGANMQSY